MDIDLYRSHKKLNNTIALRGSDNPTRKPIRVSE